MELFKAEHLEIITTGVLMEFHKETLDTDDDVLIDQSRTTIMIFLN